MHETNSVVTCMGMRTQNQEFENIVNHMLDNCDQCTDRYLCKFCEPFFEEY